MSYVETLSFALCISGTYDTAPPKFIILINDKEMHRGEALREMGPIQFQIEVEEGPLNLQIKMYGKDPAIDRSTLLNIESIQIEDIDIGFLKHTESIFNLDKEEECHGELVSELTMCVNLGFNGTYILPMASPMFIWLLERM